MNLANLGVGIVIAFYSSWVISLLVIAFVPISIMAGVLETKLITGFASKDKETIEQAGKVSNLKHFKILIKKFKQNFLIKR